MKTILFSLFFAFTGLGSLLNQTFVWDHYGIAVDVPDDFKVLKNTESEFDMKGDGMELYMNVFEEDITLETMADAVAETAIAIEMEELDRVLELTGNGLDGFYVEGYKSGHRVMLAGFIDPKSHTNFLMVITFLDTDDVADEDGIAIINSVRSNR